MPWTAPPLGAGSAIFRAHLAASLTGLPAGGKWNDLTTVYNAALFDAGFAGEPDKTLAAPAYGTAPWVAAREQSDPAGWPAGGLPVAGTGAAGGFSSAGDVVIFDGTPPGSAQTASTGLVTLPDVHGDLFYVPGGGDAACAFHWFGGPQQVTSGTFTIIWSADGIMRVEV